MFRKIIDIENLRPLKEIEKERRRNVSLGNLGAVADLVDEYGNTIDQMFYAIQDGDLEKIQALELIGLNSVEKRFVDYAVKNEQMLIIKYQVNKGASINSLIKFARDRDKLEILKWAKSLKLTNKLNKKFPPKNHTIDKKNLKI